MNRFLNEITFAEGVILALCLGMVAAGTWGMYASGLLVMPL